MMLVLIWATVILAVLVLYFRKKYSRFSSHGVKCMRPIPFVGNIGRTLLQLHHAADGMERIYKAFPEERFVGRYELVVPMIIVRDLDLAKKILVKDFEHFVDHRTMIDEKQNPLFGKTLFSMRGQEWKDMRSTLSPAFTSSKIKLMLPFMVEVADQMIITLKDKINKSGVDFIDIEAKDLTTRCANDVIASCAFGLKVNSLTDEENLFYQMNKASIFTFSHLLKFMGFLTFPKLMSKFKITLFPESVTNFFRSLVTDTMNMREAQNIIRPDMIHLLMEAKKGKLSHEDKTSKDADAGFATVEESSITKKEIKRVWSDDDIIAQAIVFIVAGYETVSSVMSFAMHELALNPDVQERLVEEIKENKVKNDGMFDYNSIQEMTYMDMVVSEVLRLWPPVINSDRQCTKDYNLGKPNNKATEDYIIRRGEGISIPTWAFHRDPQFFPNPTKFDPERFSDENKHKINPFTYMPFGTGPRNCIGSRFALCEVKVMIYQLLQHLVISPCEKTCIPAVLSTDTFNLKIKGGHWVRLKLRN